jgi:uncharacterized protein (DUF885 family)
MAVAGLREVERSYFDLRWHMDPVAATEAGVTAYDDRYGQYAGPALAAHLAALKSLATALEEAPVDGLEEEIDRTALLNHMRVTLHVFERERPQVRRPEFWLSHLLSGLHHLLADNGERPVEARATALLARLEQAPRLLEDARAALTDPVRVFAVTGMEMAQAGPDLIREAAAAAAGPETADRAAAAAAAAIAALKDFAGDLAAWVDTGSERFAVGEDDFNFRLHYEHALRDTAPELWRYGHRLKEEVQADLAERARRLTGGDGTPWPDLVDRLRADHPAAEDLVSAYAAQMRRAREFVAARRLAPIPDAPLEVVPTPAFLRPVIPFAAYQSPGAYARERTGRFYVTLPDGALPAARRERLLRDHCRHELAATALHEGYPGHHLQLVLAQAHPSDVRKNIWTPLTVEGWALYCEDMMGEQGFYATEEERFFQRLHLLWRAVRVLLDVGLHTRGLTFEQAVALMESELHVDRAHAEAEVRGYCATPAYPLCYAVGRRELLRLRDDFQGATPGAFHEAILPYGGLPATLIRWGLGLGE